MSLTASPVVEGHVSRGFEGVRQAFADNFTRRRELGGACCVYRRGEKVVDLWGGTRNKQTGEPWEKDTMVIVYSATKGLAAMTMALAHSRGGLDYEERVAKYWPEFAQKDKERITVRQLLAHQAGLLALDQPVDRARNAAVVSRHHPRVLRGRASAPDRSAASEPGAIFPGRDRVAARAGRLHPAARYDPELAPGSDCVAQPAREIARVSASPVTGGDESPLKYLSGPHRLRVAA